MASRISTPTTSESRESPRRDRCVAWMLAVVALVVLAYSNSLRGPFVFDDLPSIAENESIRHLSPPDWMRPPGSRGETVGGRPLLNLTFAIDHAIGGLDVASYHRTNLLIHALAALVAFLLVRRVVVIQTVSIRLRGAANPLAAATAMLFALHPMQTAAVTYVVQRAESLAGLFYLVTLYAYVRSTESEHPRRYAFAAVIACFLGVLTKETAATAPIVALLLDVVFLAGSLRGALIERGRLLLLLASSWIVLGALVHANSGRGGSAGFSADVSPLAYFWTQCGGIVSYLLAIVLPSRLVFDHGKDLANGPLAVLPEIGFVAIVLGASLFLLMKKRGAARACGFLGVMFFVALAPSSSIVPVATQTLAEHRMYLAILPLAAGTALALNQFLNRVGIGIAMIVAIALGGATWSRNETYRSELALWQDTISKRPTNARAHNNAGRVLLEQGRPDLAVVELRKALELEPDLLSAQSNFGNALRAVGKAEEAVKLLDPWVLAHPTYVPNRLALGNALAVLHQLDAAIAEYREARKLDPAAVDVRTNLAALLIEKGSVEEAIALLKEVVAQNPSIAEVRFHLGRALLATGQIAGGFEELQQAARLRPGLPNVHLAIGEACERKQDLEGAIAEYRRELAIVSGSVPVRNSLANALVRAGRYSEAIHEYEAALRIEPGNAAVSQNLEKARQLAARPR